MIAIDFIAQHLDKSNLKLQVIPLSQGTLCSFTGKEIRSGVKNKKLIKPTFTDNSYIKYPSDYSSVEAAMCIESVIPGATRLNALRNYSYLVTEDGIRYLKREDILEIILNLEKTPFVLCVTYSNKKHTSYKARMNYNVNNFVITTDIGDVHVDMDRVRYIVPIIQKWYTVVEGKESNAIPPTYFSKKDILTGCLNNNKIRNYGIEKYFTENKIIERFRNTAFLNLIVHILNKQFLCQK